MKTTYYKLSEDALVSTVDWPGWDTVRQVKDSTKQYWIVAEDISKEELTENLKYLELHPLITEDCLSSDHKTLVDRYLDAVYIEFPTNAGQAYGDIAYLSIICLPDTIFTIRRGDVAHLPGCITSLQQERKLTIGNTANLLYLLVDYFTDQTITQSLVYRQQLNDMEKKLIDDPESIDPNDITNLIRQITQLESICADQLYCTKAINLPDDPVINTAGQEAYFNDLVSNGEYALRSITRLNGRIKDIQDTFNLQNHESSEKRLRVLTIISVIFLPLTFITGFFGMNFINMRLLNQTSGSLIAAAIMIIIILGLLWYFNSRGWFD